MSARPELRRFVDSGISALRDPTSEDRGIVVAFLDRTGGSSRAPFDSLNLAVSVGDARETVASNRTRAGSALGFDEGSLALARQVHGTTVIEVGPGEHGVLGDADGLVTSIPGVTLAILTADCAPVVLAGEGRVAIVHAGWRGLAAGVIESGIAAVGAVKAAWVGPCIHACCYEVGRDVIDAFEGCGLPIADAHHVDPGRAATVALYNAGVESVVASTDCTSCESRYFSYRRDGVTGRQGAFVRITSR